MLPLLLPFLVGSSIATCPAGSFAIPQSDTCASVQTKATVSGYFEAQLICRGMNGNLTSVRNAFTNGMIYAFAAQDNLSGSIFLGADNHSGSWKWLDGTPLSYSNWAAGQPSASGDCATMNLDDSLWYSVPCTQGLPYFCEVPKIDAITCPQGWLLHNDSCYLLQQPPQSITWEAARSICLCNYADLASIHSADENQFLTALLTGGDFIWIGLQYNNGLQWSDGSVVDFNNDTGNPHYNGDVFHLHSLGSSNAGIWDESNQGAVEAFFVCKRKSSVVCAAAVMTEAIHSPLSDVIEEQEQHSHKLPSTDDKGKGMKSH